MSGTRPPAPANGVGEPIVAAVAFENCPIRVSLGSLGRKWTLLILRDVAFFPGSSFSTIQRNNPGLGNRILSMRLKQLLREGLIERLAGEGTTEVSGYILTERGRAVLPVLTALIQYGAWFHAGEVFADQRPRRLEEVFPAPRDYLVGGLAEYVRGDPTGPLPSTSVARSDRRTGGSTAGSR
ncbi:MAG TPA: helix-turn-helix domain-containing protein [Thermoplasmata archaeon]|nr:helix-turn-helix domain-containing protein [Thermoplasmata archaeon]